MQFCEICKNIPLRLSFRTNINKYKTKSHTRPRYLSMYIAKLYIHVKICPIVVKQLSNSVGAFKNMKKLN